MTRAKRAATEWLCKAAAETHSPGVQPTRGRQLTHRNEEQRRAEEPGQLVGPLLPVVVQSAAHLSGKGAGVKAEEGSREKVVLP